MFYAMLGDKIIASDDSVYQLKLKLRDDMVLDDGSRVTILQTFGHVEVLRNTTIRDLPIGYVLT